MQRETFCALVEHCQWNGSDADEVATMLGNGMLNIVIPQLRQRLSSVYNEALGSAMAEYAGSYSHKNNKAKELLQVQI